MFLFGTHFFLGVSCTKGGGDFSSLDADQTVAATCAITTTNPTIGETALRVSGVSGSKIEFSVGLSDSKCVVKFSLNGTEVASSGTSVVISADTLLPNTTNVLTATSGTSKKSWNIEKNRAPVCGVQSPGVTGVQLGAGVSLTLSGAASDPDADAITFAWKVNGADPSTSVLNAVSSSTSSIGVFTPTTSFLGNTVVSLAAFDGIDTTSCNWNINVNGACAISSTTPSSSAPIRIAQASSSPALFQATATSGCQFTWKLNGVTLAGQTAATFNLDPATLIAGNNTLEVSAGNSSSADSKTWTVLRNIAPSCASQSPGTATVTVGVGGFIDLDGVGSDANGDPISFSWSVNGTPAGSQFAISNTATTAHARFSPDSSNSGTNNIKAVISDGLDASNCSWVVQTVPVCQIATSNPTTATLKVSAAPGSTQTFIATPNDSSCALTWTLNGTPIAGATTQVLNLLSSQLSNYPAVNTLVATAANSFTSTSRTWTVSKNQAPTCSAQVPGMSGNNVGAGGSITFDATAGNSEGDSLVYTWTYNGIAASPSYFTLSSSGNTSQAVFAPTAGQIGNNQFVSVGINDGYDGATCNWNVNVLNACVISSTTPTNPGPVKVPNLGTATTSFQAVANSGCNYSWSLNGTPVSGATSNAYMVPSANLNSGNNTLQVSVTNGISTDTKAWTVVKNTPSTCATLNPSAAANVGVGGTINFQLTAGNTDSDNLTYSWLYNGSPATNASFFTPTAFGNSAQLAFTPDSSFIGNNQAVGVTINDGYDNTSCSYTANVVNSCTISATTPALGSAVRVPNSPTATKIFQASASAGCNYTWTLNGVAISGATSSSYTVPSTDLT
ncbi:MAG: hypothetical protein K2X47_11425, partial [Bdellovibrionales bacterium]|nr:hypothetical protein [Bdellovibrionales bacterium]